MTDDAVLLAHHTTLRVGGPAAQWAVADTPDALVDAVRAADAAGAPVLLLGGGSNLLVADEGFPGLVVEVAARGVDLVADGKDAVLATAAAGEPWAPFVANTVSRGLAGIEALAGIPGSTGATPIQNVGAYGQEVAQTITSVRAYDRVAQQVVDLSAQDCGFGYRSSLLKSTPGRYVVLAVTFRLDRSPMSRPIRYAELARRLGVEVDQCAPTGLVHDTVLELRRGKGMVLDPADHDTWSAGSFFTNPVVSAETAAGLPADAPQFPVAGGRVKLSAAWLIGHSGFARGFGNDRAALSTKHTLALTNRGSATAADVLDLARRVRDGVLASTGIELVPEPVLVGCTL